MIDATWYWASASSSRPRHLKRLRVVHANDLQIRMELDTLTAKRCGRVEIALPAEHQHFGGRQRRQQRIRLFAAAQDGERFVEAPQRPVEHAQPHVGRPQRRLLLQRLQELGFRFDATLFEHVDAERAVAAQFGAEAARRGGLLVRLEKARIHLQRTPHTEDGQREVRRREALEGAEIGRTLGDRALERIDGPFASGAGALAPEVPSLAHEFVRPRHFQGVAELRPMDDPAAVLTEVAPHVADRDVDGMGRDVRPLPRLHNHRVVIDERTVMLEQHLQRPVCERPQPHVHAVAGQPGRDRVQAKGSEGEFRHRQPRQAGERQSPPGSAERPIVGIDSLDPGCYDPRLDAMHYTQQALRAPVASRHIRQVYGGTATLASAGTPRRRSVAAIVVGVEANRSGIL